MCFPKLPFIHLKFSLTLGSPKHTYNASNSSEEIYGARARGENPGPERKGKKETPPQVLKLLEICGDSDISALNPT